MRGSQVLCSLDSGLCAVTNAIESSSAELVAVNEESKLWNLRCIHLVCPVNADKESLDCICKVCPRAKQTRLSFPVHVNRSESCFELIRVDTWGPYKSVTHDGCSWFLTIVDDCTRHTWVFPMKN